VSGEASNVRQAVPFFMVSDMEASVRFYVDGLGFEITHRWVGDDGKLRWCCMRNGAATLMLQEYSREGHGPGRPEGKLGLGVSICFVCRDALAIYREVKRARRRGRDALRRKRDVGHVADGSGRLPDRLREPHGRARRDGVLEVTAERTEDPRWPARAARTITAGSQTKGG
jgi:catechol 2,3-dioxygenase-like lactoylglutathione lyase family enzyme